MTEFNCLLLGAGAAGKTEYINANVGSLLTNYGNVKFHFIDLNVLPLDGTTKIDCVFIMFDITDKKSFDQVSQIYNQDVLSKLNVPIALIANKIDDKHHAVEFEEIHQLVEQLNMDYYAISAKTLYHVREPLIGMSKKLLNRHDLILTA